MALTDRICGSVEPAGPVSEEAPTEAPVEEAKPARKSRRKPEAAETPVEAAGEEPAPVKKPRPRKAAASAKGS